MHRRIVKIPMSLARISHRGLSRGTQGTAPGRWREPEGDAGMVDAISTRLEGAGRGRAAHRGSQQNGVEGCGLRPEVRWRHPLRLLVAAVALSLSVGSVSEAQERPAVTLASGVLLGTAKEGIHRFLGVPYAAPPVGERRWMPPLQARAWEGAYDASRFGAACPQAEDQFSGTTPVDRQENCLYLNVWTPERVSESSPLPVMVWLHGGGHRIGAGSLPFYDGSRLAERGVVVVTVNFRLGYLGFFDHPALAGQGGGGNFGLMDQVLALQWVRDNIDAFGGDPQRVTIFGESAGGADVLYLMTSPAAAGLFRRAIVQSGGGWNEPLSAAEMRKQVVSNLKASGVSENADADTLRALEPAILLQAQSVKRQMGFGPFIDEKVVLETPYQVFADGRQSPVPLLIGSNSWEANLMPSFNLGWRGTFLTRVLTRIPPVSGWYADRADNAAQRGELLFGDLIFGAPARWVAARHAERANAWLYYYDYVRAAQRDKVPGAGHAAEIVFVFDTLDIIPALSAVATEEDRRMAAALADCWVAFATHGVPRCDISTWSPYEEAEDNILLIDREPREVRHPYGEVLDAINKRFGPG